MIEYEIALFGELGGFFAKLGNRRLEDLDFSAYNHTYNDTQIVHSWENLQYGKGYYYPLIDYGNVSTDKQNYDYRAFRPGLFVGEIFDKIITGNGYTWESEFFKTNFAKSLIIPNNQDRLTTVKTQALQAQPYIIGGISNFVNIPIINPIGNSFDAVDFNNAGLAIKYKYNGPNYALTTSISMNGTLQLYPKLSAGLFPVPIYPRTIYFTGYIAFFLNGIEVSGSRQNYSNSYTAIDQYVSNTINFSYNYTTSINYNTNDEIELIFNVTSLSTASGITKDNLFIDSRNSNNNIKIFSLVPVVLPAIYGDDITLNSTLPINIKQKDFFTSILKMFYLMVTEDKYKEKHLIIEPWVDFYQNDRTTYLDWSDKVDRSQAIKLKPMSELNARYYQLLYKSDNDWRNEEYRKLYQEGYGDRIYDNGFEFAKETDKTEVIFSATPLVGYVVNNVQVDKIVSAIYKRNNTLEERMASNIRILYANVITGKSNWYIQNNGSNISPALDYYGYAGHLNDPDVPSIDINFGATKQLYFT